MKDNTKFWIYMALALIVGLVIGYLVGNYIFNTTGKVTASALDEDGGGGGGGGGTIRCWYGGGCTCTPPNRPMTCIFSHGTRCFCTD